MVALVPGGKLTVHPAFGVQQKHQFGLESLWHIQQVPDLLLALKFTGVEAHSALAFWPMERVALSVMCHTPIQEGTHPVSG